MRGKMRLGIFGGTFSPPHIGHIKAASAFITYAELDELLIMPTYLPPHKDSEDIICANDRLKMCRLAFSGVRGASVSDYEIKKGGKSYTYVTLTDHAADERELFFLVGTDMFLTLDEWKNPSTVFSLATIALIRREDDPDVGELIAKKAEEYKEKYGARLMFIPEAATEISSTEIRERVLHGEDTSGLIPQCVREYIDEHLIYKSSFTDAELSALREAVKGKMSKSRYLHTLGVENTALKIADYCLPHKKSALSAAALLHDVAKEIDEGELFEIIKSNPDITEDDLSSPKLYHAFAAPYIIKRDFPEFATREILSSSFNHTAGSENMSLFDEIIFVADYVEPSRQYPTAIRARDELFRSLDERSVKKSVLALHKCSLAEIESTARHLWKSEAHVNKRMLRAKEYMEQKIKESR